MTSRLSRAFRALASALVLTATLAPSWAGASPLNALGLDPSLNLLSFGDFNAYYSDVQGRVAVGGNAAIQGYSVNLAYQGTQGPGLVVGGNLNFYNGTVWGDTLVGGNLTSNYSGAFTGNVFVGGNLNASQGLSVGGGNKAYVSGSSVSIPGVNLPIAAAAAPFDIGFDFASEAVRLNALSDQLGIATPTGVVSDLWGTLVLDATGRELAVFDITAADAARNMVLQGLSDTATVIINISGNVVDFGFHGYTNFMDAAGRILFNLPDATSVTLSSAIYGSILAPGASVQHQWGLVTGQVVAANWYSSVQVNDVPFGGDLPRAATPEPGTVMLLGAGVLFAALSRMRSRAGRAPKG